MSASLSEAETKGTISTLASGVNVIGVRSWCVKVPNDHDDVNHEAPDGHEGEQF